jgi:hypothetical protein
MPSPFPGMDPYCEAPSIWPDVHHELIGDIQAALNAVLRPRYVARVDLRTYASDEPMLMDEAIKEAFLKVLHLATAEVVTIIEVVSPTDMIRDSRGRASFMSKRREIMNSEVHWVEIDLLRAGVPTVTDPPLPANDYRVLIARAHQRTKTRVWPISVRQGLPVIPIPLRGKDPEVPLDLGAVFREACDRAAYDATLDYRKEPQPPLKDEDAQWARERLRGRGGSQGGVDCTSPPFHRTSAGPGFSTRRPRSCKNRAAGAPSTMRWSKVRLKVSTRPTTTLSSTATGRRSIRPTPRIAHSG